MPDDVFHGKSLGRANKFQYQFDSTRKKELMKEEDIAVAVKRRKLAQHKAGGNGVLKTGRKKPKLKVEPAYFIISVTVLNVVMLFVYCICCLF